MTYSSAIIERNTEQIDLFQALELVESAMDREWGEAAYARVKYLCQTRVEFTTDEIWSHLDTLDCKTGESRALGAVMRNAAKDGLCVSTGRFVKSNRPECHSRPICVWRSLVLLNVY